MMNLDVTFRAIKTRHWGKLYGSGNSLLHSSKLRSLTGFAFKCHRVKFVVKKKNA